MDTKDLDAELRRVIRWRWLTELTAWERFCLRLAGWYPPPAK